MLTDGAALKPFLRDCSCILKPALIRRVFHFMVPGPVLRRTTMGLRGKINLHPARDEVQFAQMNRGRP